MARPLARTFISYSRKDGARAAKCLRWWLIKHHLSIWQDLVALRGGRDWWSQIEDALRSKALQHFILVVTPGALASQVVRREIRLARQEGKTVCPVKGSGLTDLGQVPRWIGHIYDLKIDEQRTALITLLQAESLQERVPMMAPEPPPDFVQRPREFDALKAQLCDAKGDSVAAITTAALRGAGGYGKTTLAKKLAHDPDIQDIYFDGILWAELGEKPDRLLSTLSDLITMLTGEPPALETINAAAAKLGEALGDRRILMVVDDAWREQDLRPFLQGGRNTVRLVTTRIDSVLPATAVRQHVDAMQPREAVNLLSAGLPAGDVSRERANLARLAARLGEWAQLLKIVNGSLRDLVVRAHEPLSVAIAGLNKRLDARGLVDAFDPRDETDRDKAVARIISVGLERFTNAERALFGELGVFPEDAEIPVGVAERLWAAAGGLADFETEDLLRRLFDLSLLLDLDLGQRFFRLHDTTRGFLQSQAGREGVVEQHRRLLAALDPVPSEHSDARARRYYYLSLAHHLAEAGERKTLDALLLDPGWLKAKLAVTGNPYALFADYQQYGASEAQKLVGRTLRLISGVCMRDERQLLPQLVGRLAGLDCIVATGFVEEARRLVPRPAIVPIRPSLTPPGEAETDRLEGHSGSVDALCQLWNGQLASGSRDSTIRLWDVATGAEAASPKKCAEAATALCQLRDEPFDGWLASGSDDGTIWLWDMTSDAKAVPVRGHAGKVAALCQLRDGRLVSGSHDKTIRMWNLKIRAEATPPKKCADAITALCELSDGRLASGSRDKTIRVWDVETEAEDAFKGHEDEVTALCQLRDGRLVSGSHDRTIRLWDLNTRVEAIPPKKYADAITALCELSDGRLASGSDDKTIRVWDVSTGTETALKGHGDSVTALYLLTDGRLASASGADDKTIRIWDATRTQTVRHPTLSVCLLPDGRLATGSTDGAIRLWDGTSAAEITLPQIHTASIEALCLLADGRLASGSYDGTIVLWDVKSRVVDTVIKYSPGFLTALCELADKRLASGHYNGTIRLWDISRGAETDNQNYRGAAVTALCLLPDGRLVSGSSARTIGIWNVSTGKIEHLEVHDDSCNALCLLRDGRLASGHFDGAIRLWDVSTGTGEPAKVHTKHLKGHTRSVHALCVLPDGRLASGSRDKTIRLWDVSKGAEVARLDAEAPVRALAAVASKVIVAGDESSLHWLQVVD